MRINLVSTCIIFVSSRTFYMSNTTGNTEGTRGYTISYLKICLCYSPSWGYSSAPSSSSSLSSPSSKTPKQTGGQHTLIPTLLKPTYLRSLLNRYNNNYHRLLNIYYFASSALSTLSRSSHLAFIFNLNLPVISL